MSWLMKSESCFNKVRVCLARTDNLHHDRTSFANFVFLEVYILPSEIKEFADAQARASIQKN